MSDNSELLAVIEKMKEKLQEQNKLLEQLTSPPFKTAVVVHISPNKIGVVDGMSGSMELVAPLTKGRVKLGDIVLRSFMTGQIVEAMPDFPEYGVMTIVAETDEKSPYCSIEINGQTKRVIKGNAGKDVEAGHRVVVDNAGTIILRDLGKPKSAFKTERTDNVTWEMIGGLTRAKELLREAVEYPLEYKDVYKKFGKKAANGLLLYGPPGCGKTMLAKAVANSLRKHAGGSSGSNFIYVKGPELLERWVGAAEANIRYLFSMGRQHFAENGYPAVLFIDEADALLAKRGSRVSSDMEMTIVPQFLSEMSGLESSGTITLLATNRPDVLDPAIVRDGRIDQKIYISRPDKDAARSIIQINLKDAPCEARRDNLANAAVDHIFNGHRFYNMQLDNGETVDFGLQHILSGAMLAGIADKAISMAMTREIACKKAQSVTKDDMEAAVIEVFNQNKDLNHTDAMSEFAESLGVRIVGATKCCK